jgi:hypothetical protein
MRLLVVAYTLLGICIQASGQSVFTPMGARSMGMAGASATLSDGWALFNNVAGMAGQKQACAFAYEVAPQMPGANRMAAIAQMQMGSFTGGIGFFRFGDALYNEHLISFAMAHRIGITALGARVNYNQYRADGFGSLYTFSADVGGITQLTSKIRVGAYLTNITQSSLNSGSGERLPTRMVVGAGFQFSPKFLASTEIEKDLDYPIIWRTGFEYEVRKNIFFRTGYQLQPSVIYVGLGGTRKRLTIDYAMRYHFLLGMIHQASATFRWASSNPASPK